MLSLLCPMSATVPFGSTAAFAADLAVGLDAALTGLCATQVVVPMPVIDAPLFLDDIVDDLRAQRDRAIAAAPAFVQWARERGVSAASWQVCEGPLDQALAVAGNWHDAVVLGVAPSGRDPWQRVALLGSLLIGLGHPCVVVPPGAVARLSCVAVAWNGSREAMRAVHAALPLLRRAERIVLLESAQTPAERYGTWHPPFELDRFLELHGLAAPARTLAQADWDGTWLDEAAAAAGADLLVMGAYGHRRVNEWLFGGMTRHALEHSRIPLFMRH